MMVIEATDKATGRKLASLCLTDPFDGGSRERNREEREAWESKLREKHPGQEIEIACYLD